jgi:glycosyltransferase involved in cell wall biosynthesis
MASTVSIVINTKNEERHIKRCLDSILNQTYPLEWIEIVVVDNNSDDKTKEIAEKFANDSAMLNLKIFNIGPERSAQKNFGARSSTGEFLLFLDADMAVSENVIQECVERMGESQRIVGLYIREDVIGNRFWSRVRMFERGFYNGTSIDAVRFVRKSAFDDTYGFDEVLYACEDWDFNKRIKELGDFSQINLPIYHDEADFTVKNYLQKKGYYILNMNIYIKKWGKNDKDIRKQFGLCYRYFVVFVEKEKWKRVVLHPILFSGMYILKILVGIKFLSKKAKTNG